MDVFLSHTSELAKHPEKRTFVDAALDAIRQVGMVGKDMRDFTSEPLPPSALCERAVRQCQVYVGLLGLRYGSPVRDRQEVSYTQLEFHTAVAGGLPPLIFLLDEQVTGLPADATRDSKYGQRQDEFRRQVQDDHGLTCSTFKTPDELHRKIYQALLELPPATSGKAPVPADKGLNDLALNQACRAQVATEIASRVGKKYLRQLFQRASLEHDIHEFLAADLDRRCITELVAVLRRLTEKTSSEIPATTLRDLAQSVDPLDDYREALEQTQRAAAQLPEAQSRLLASALEHLPRFRPSCFLVKDKAGSGKTNLLCSLAESDHEKSYRVLITCKALLWNEANIEQMLGQAIARSWPDGEPHESVQPLLRHGDQHFLLAIARRLRETGQQLVVFLDGINENRDLDKLQEFVVRGFESLHRFPVKFVVTCRDIFWSFFDSERWEPFLYRRRTFELPGFAPEQMDDVIAGYFNHFEITGQIIGRARQQCQHPLLLRFFCEAYRGKDIRQYDDLRLKDLFQKYWRRKKTEIADSLGLTRQGSGRVEAFLYRLGDSMLRQTATRLPVRQIPEVTGEADLDSRASLYQRFLDEDIILEELPPDSAFDRSFSARRVTFVYDEFYDYVLALAHVQKQGWDDKNLREICLDFSAVLRQARSFEQMRGMAEYLVLIAESRNYHRELCAVLARTAQHEILCSVLPKLRGEMDWAVNVLACCLESVESLCTKTSRKAKDELPDVFGEVDSVLESATADKDVFHSLIQ